MSIKSDKSVCIIGLGFVGLTLAVVMANKGFKVYGVEKNKSIVNSLKKKQAHFYEPGLKENLKKIIKKKNFLFFNKIPIIKSISTYIITVGTPLNSKKKITTHFISKAVNQISSILKNNDMIILRSTVKIGTTKKLVFPILKKTGKKFNLAFCPERSVEGSALKELLNLPQIIGGVDKDSENRALSIFKKITKKTIVTSNVETAEMIKLIDNSSRDVFFAYANEIARICDAIGLDASEVIGSGKLDYNRTDIAKPGLVGGPCLYKDPYIFSESVKRKGLSAEITLMARKINERQPYEIVDFIYNFQKKIKKFPNKLKISLLGLAFKGTPVTDDLRGSMALEVFKALKNKFKSSKFYGYDPLVSKANILKLGLKKISSLEDSFKNKDLVVILNDHKIFSTMPIEKFSKNLNKPSIIYDFWNHFSRRNLNLAKSTQYISLGSHYKSKKNI